MIADDLDGRRCVFLTGLHRAEREIAEKLKALAVGKPPLIDADKAIPWVEKRTKLALAETSLHGSVVRRRGLDVIGAPHSKRTKIAVITSRVAMPIPRLASAAIR